MSTGAHSFQTNFYKVLTLNCWSKIKKIKWKREKETQNRFEWHTCEKNKWITLDLYLCDFDQYWLLGQRCTCLCVPTLSTDISRFIDWFRFKMPKIQFISFEFVFGVSLSRSNLNWIDSIKCSLAWLGLVSLEMHFNFYGFDFKNIIYRPSSFFLSLFKYNKLKLLGCVSSFCPQLLCSPRMLMYAGTHIFCFVWPFTTYYYIVVTDHISNWTYLRAFQEHLWDEYMVDANIHRNVYEKCHINVCVFEWRGGKELREINFNVDMHAHLYVLFIVEQIEGKSVSNHLCSEQYEYK